MIARALRGALWVALPLALAVVAAIAQRHVGGSFGEHESGVEVAPQPAADPLDAERKRRQQRVDAGLPIVR